MQATFQHALNKGFPTIEKRLFSTITAYFSSWEAEALGLPVKNASEWRSTEEDSAIRT